VPQVVQEPPGGGHQNAHTCTEQEADIVGEREQDMSQNALLCNFLCFPPQEVLHGKLGHVLCITVQYNTGLFCPVQYCTVRHSPLRRRAFSLARFSPPVAYPGTIQTNLRHSFTASSWIWRHSSRVGARMTAGTRRGHTGNTHLALTPRTQEANI